SGYVAGTVRCFSIRLPRIRCSTASRTGRSGMGSTLGGSEPDEFPECPDAPHLERRPAHEVLGPQHQHLVLGQLVTPLVALHAVVPVAHLAAHRERRRIV